MARLLLGGASARATRCPSRPQRLARRAGAPSAAIELRRSAARARGAACPLRDGGADRRRWSSRRRSTPTADDRRCATRVAPALGALLAAALERDALLHEVVETQALRRST